MIRSIKYFVLFFLGMGLSMLHAQDTIMLQSVEVKADKYNVETLKPLVARQLDTLVLQSKSTSSLSDLLIQHSPVFIKTRCRMERRRAWNPALSGKS